MEIEKQVCSSELAKRLKELGEKQDSLWYWQWNCVACKYFLRTKNDVESSIYPYEHYYSAFTVAELGEMLPGGYYSQKQRNSWGCADADNHLAVANIYDCDNKYTEADARAKMRIYLIENKGLIER